MFGIHCPTLLSQLSFGFCRPQPITHVAIIFTLLGLAEHMYRASDNPRRSNALAVNFAPRPFWQLAITGCQGCFDFFRSIVAHTTRLMQILRTLLCHRLFSPSDPCWVDEYPNGRPNISLEQHFTQATRVKVFQHTIHRPHESLDFREAHGRFPPLGIFCVNTGSVYTSWARDPQGLCTRRGQGIHDPRSLVAPATLLVKTCGNLQSRTDCEPSCA